MGAGILPVTMSNGILLFLMGKERSNNLWSDFGGSRENGEQPLTTAIREGGEELNGILELENKLAKKVTNSMIAPIEFNKYTSFLFNLEYDKNLVDTFKNNNYFAEIYLNDKIDKRHNGLFEKSEIKWFSIKELNDNIDNFRPHFIPIVKTIVFHQDKIKYSVIEYNTKKIIKFHQNHHPSQNHHPQNNYSRNKFSRKYAEYKIQ